MLYAGAATDPVCFFLNLSNPVSRMNSINMGIGRGKINQTSSPPRHSQVLRTGFLIVFTSTLGCRAATTRDRSGCGVGFAHNLVPARTISQRADWCLWFVFLVPRVCQAGSRNALSKSAREFASDAMPTNNSKVPAFISITNLWCTHKRRGV